VSKQEAIVARVTVLNLLNEEHIGPERLCVIIDLLNEYLTKRLLVANQLPKAKVLV